MSKKCLLMMLILAAAACVPALAQLDMRNGESWSADLRIGAYDRQPEGNQSWIREYDGRFFGPGIESLEVYGYKGHQALRFGIRDWVIGDEEFDLAWSSGSTYGLRMSSTRMTHNLARVPAVNPFLAGTPAAGGDDFLELSPNAKLQFDRRTNEGRLNLTPGDGQRVRLAVGWWQETEDGTQQILMRRRGALPGDAVTLPPLPPGTGGSVRFATVLPIARQTDEASVGVDAALWKDSAMSYRFSNMRFDDDRPSPTVALPPFNRLIAPTTQTQSHVLKIRSRMSDRLFFTGAHTNRNRNNRTSALDIDGFPVPRTNSVDLDSTNASLAFYATDALTLTGRYRRHRLDNRVPPFLDANGLPENMAMTRHENSISLDASFTGIPRLYINGSYEDVSADRVMSSLHHGHEEFEHPFTSHHTDSKIWRAAARYYPTSRLSLNGSYERWSIDGPAFNGSPTDRKKVDAQATYMASDNLGLFANYNLWDDENNDLRVADIPTASAVIVDDPATLEDEAAVYSDARSTAAGQNYRNKVATTDVGAWLALNPKLTLDVNYGRIRTDADALWIIGVDPAFLPHLIPSFTPYDATNSMWSTGLTYAFRPHWRVYSRFLHSKSEGEMLLDLAGNGNGTTIPAGDLDVGPVWQPVDVIERGYTLGFGYDLSASEQILLEYTLGKWEDQIDSSQSGRFGLWRVAWRHKL